MAYLKSTRLNFNKRFSLTPVQLMVLGYFLFTIIGTILLILPFSLNTGKQLNLIDAFFTATSAVSVTGLTVVSTPDTFSLTGRVILSFLLQFGGIGIMALGTLVYILSGTKIHLRTYAMIRTDQNQTSTHGMVSLMLFILKVAVIFEILGAIILTTRFFLNYHMPFSDALGMGIFHSISGFTNAGFDLFGDGLQNFQQDYLIQSVISILLLSGAIGFPVLLEAHSYYLSLRKKTRFTFSLYTKVTTITFLTLLFLGFIFVLLSELHGSLANMSWQEKISVAFFHSLNTRNGGFSTIDINVFSTPTLLFLSLLMFIGASPSSCGGGIRTTTFAINVISVFSYMRGRNSVKIMNRELYQEDILKSFMISFFAAMLVIVSVIFLMETENFASREILFEVCSAFGTTGLSTGIVTNLSVTGKLIIIFLMFVGRIGILSLLMLLHNHRSKDKYHIIKERIIIG